MPRESKSAVVENTVGLTRVKYFFDDVLSAINNVLGESDDERVSWAEERKINSF